MRYEELCYFRRKLKEDEEKNRSNQPKKRRRIVKKKEVINPVTHNDAIFQVIQVSLIIVIV
jgi:hypothetical protein